MSVRDRYNAVEGQRVRLYMRFYANGVLIDPTSLGSVLIAPEDEPSGVLVSFTAPVRESLGTYYVEWRVPSSDPESPYYNVLFASYVDRGMRNMRDTWNDIAVGGAVIVQYGNFYVRTDDAEVTFDPDNLLAFDYSILTPTIGKGSNDYFIVEAIERENRISNTGAEFPDGQITIQKDQGRVRQWQDATSLPDNGKYSLRLDTSVMEIGRYSARLKLLALQQAVQTKATVTGNRNLPTGYDPPAGEDQTLAVAIDGVRQSFEFSSNAARARVCGMGREWAFPAKVESTAGITSTRKLNGAELDLQIDNKTFQIKFGTYRNVTGATVTGGGNVVLTFATTRPSNVQVGDVVYKTTWDYDDPRASAIIALGPSDYEVTLASLAIGDWNSGYPYEVGLGVLLNPSDVVSQINTAANAELGYSIAETFVDGVDVKYRISSKTRNSNTAVGPAQTAYVELVAVGPSAAMKTDFEDATKLLVGAMYAASGTDFTATVSPNAVNNVLKVAVDPTGGGTSFQNVALPNGYWSAQQVIDFINAQSTFAQAQLVSKQAAIAPTTPAFMLKNKTFQIEANDTLTGALISYAHTFTGDDPHSLDDIAIALNAAYVANNVDVTVTYALVGPTTYRLILTSGVIGTASSITILDDQTTGANSIIGFDEGDSSSGADPLTGATAYLLPDSRMELRGDVVGSASSLIIDSEANGSVANTLLGFPASGATAYGTDNAPAYVQGRNGQPEPLAIVPSTQATLTSQPVPAAGLDLDGMYLDLQIDDARFTVNFTNIETQARLTADTIVTAADMRSGFRHFFQPLSGSITYSPDGKYIGTLCGGGYAIEDESGTGYVDIESGNGKNALQAFGYLPGNGLIYGNGGFIRTIDTVAQLDAWGTNQIIEDSAADFNAPVEMFSYISRPVQAGIDEEMHLQVGAVDKGILNFAVNFYSLAPSATYSMWPTALAKVRNAASTAQVTIGGSFRRAFGAFHIAVSFDPDPLLSGVTPFQSVSRNFAVIGRTSQSFSADGSLWWVLDLIDSTYDVAVGDVLNIGGDLFTVANVLSRSDDKFESDVIEQVDNKLGLRFNDSPVPPNYRSITFTTGTQTAGDMIQKVNTTVWGLGDQGRADIDNGRIYFESDLAGVPSKVDLIHPVLGGGSLVAMGFQPDTLNVTMDTVALGSAHQFVHLQFDPTRILQVIDAIARTEGGGAVTDGGIKTGNLKCGMAFVADRGPFGNTLGAAEGHAYLFIETTDNWNASIQVTFVGVPFTISSIGAIDAANQRTALPLVGSRLYELWGVNGTELCNGYSAVLNATTGADELNTLSLNGARPHKSVGQQTIYAVVPTPSMAAPEWIVVNDVDENARQDQGVSNPLTASNIVDQINNAALSNGIATQPATVITGNKVFLTSSDYGSRSMVLLWHGSHIAPTTIGALNAHAALGFYADMAHVTARETDVVGLSSFAAGGTIYNEATDNLTGTYYSRAVMNSIVPLEDPANPGVTLAVGDVTNVMPSPLSPWVGIHQTTVSAAVGAVTITVPSVAVWIEKGTHAWVDDSTFGAVVSVTPVGPNFDIVINTTSAAAAWLNQEVNFANGWPTEGIVGNAMAASTSYFTGGKWAYGRIGTDGNDVWRVEVNSTEYVARVSSALTYADLATALTSSFTVANATESPTGSLLMESTATGVLANLRVKGLLEGGTGADQLGFGSSVLHTSDPNVMSFQDGEPLVNINDPTFKANVAGRVNFQTMVLGNANKAASVGDILQGMSSGIRTTVGSMLPSAQLNYAALDNNGGISTTTTFAAGYETLGFVGSDNAERRIKFDLTSYDRTALLNHLNAPRIGVETTASAIVNNGDLLITGGVNALGAGFVDDEEGKAVGGPLTVRLQSVDTAFFRVTVGVMTAFTPGTRVTYAGGEAIVITTTNTKIINGLTVIGLIADPSTPTTLPSPGDVLTEINTLTNITIGAKDADEITFALDKDTDRYVYNGGTTNYDLDAGPSAWTASVPHKIEFNPGSTVFAYDASWNLIIRDHWVAGSFDPASYPKWGSIFVHDTSITSAWANLELDPLQGQDGLWDRVGGSGFDSTGVALNYSIGTDEQPPSIVSEYPLAANMWITSTPNAQLNVRFDDDVPFREAVLNTSAVPTEMTLWDIIDQVNGFGLAIGIDAVYPVTVQINHTILRLSFNGGASFDVIYTAGTTYTAQEIVDEINNAIALNAPGQGAADVWNGQVLIMSFVMGITSEVIVHEDDGITPGGFINGWLGFPFTGVHSWGRGNPYFEDAGSSSGYLGTGIRGLLTVEDFLPDAGQACVSTVKYPATNDVSAVEIASVFSGSTANPTLGFSRQGVGPIYGIVSDFTYTLDDIINMINAAYGGFTVAVNAGNALRLQSIQTGAIASVEILSDTTWHVQRTFGLVSQLVNGTEYDFTDQVIVSPWLYFEVV